MELETRLVATAREAFPFRTRIARLVTDMPRFVTRLFLFCGVCCVAFAQQGSVPTAVRVALSGKPGELVVSWTTFNKTATSIVQYTCPGSAPQTVTGNAIVFVDPNPLQIVRFIHTAVIVNLPPNAACDYVVGDADGGWSPSLSFKTPVNGDEVLNMIVYGDLGLVNSVSMGLIQQEVQSGAVDIVLHTGDYAYDLHTDDGMLGDIWLHVMQPITSAVPYMGRFRVDGLIIPAPVVITICKPVW